MTSLVVLHNIPSSAPAPWYHMLPGDPPLLLLVEGSRLFELESATGWAESDLRELTGPPAGPAGPLPKPAALTLNVAQACNLSCSYCYADEGRFGGAASMMTIETAQRVIDDFLGQAPRDTVTLGFMGGEPFLNRTVVHAATAYAKARARALGRRIGFSVTTNGTLLNDNDLDVLRREHFSVSVSLDGGAQTNDAFRRTHDGSSASARVLDRLRPLLENPGGARVAARATITRLAPQVAERIEALADTGFRDIGVSPLRTSPDPTLAFGPGDWPRLLASMTNAGDIEINRLRSGLPPRFSNLNIALKQIHLGSARTLPCGSGDNYVSVSASGDYFTCHRTIDDPRFALGTGGALDDASRERFVASRRVDTQEPCRSCWARYLCGGGCHAEVVQSGRTGCDYIRGWLEYCLRSYDSLLRDVPEYFENLEHPTGLP